jgi:hypothetical protein
VVSLSAARGSGFCGRAPRRQGRFRNFMGGVRGAPPSSRAPENAVGPSALR